MKRSLHAPILVVALLGGYLAAAPRSAVVIPSGPQSGVGAETDQRLSGAPAELLPSDARPTSGGDGVPTSRPSVGPTAAVTPRPTARPTSAGRDRTEARYGVPWLSRSGLASNMGRGFPASYLALPHGPGWLARICGAGGCVTMASVDAGPALSMQRAGRVADLSVAVFERVCGVPASFGLCDVSVTILGKAR